MAFFIKAGATSNFFNILNVLSLTIGEHIRRVMDSPPVNIGREILGLEIPDRSSDRRATDRSSGSTTVGSAYSAVGGVAVGSAHSALHGSNNSHNSQNGNSH